MIFTALSGKHARLAAMYAGACHVLVSGNPDHLALAAHNVRELIEKLPDHVDDRMYVAAANRGESAYPPGRRRRALLPATGDRTRVAVPRDATRAIGRRLPPPRGSLRAEQRGAGRAVSRRMGSICRRRASYLPSCR